MASFATLPSQATLPVKKFRAHVDEDKLQHFKKLLELSPIAPPVYENTHVGRKYGISRDWLENAKKVWLNDFDWRKQEDRINSFPNFTAPVKDGKGNTIDIQFLALFSERPDAVPIAFFHGWPASLCEFLDILDILGTKYSPADLPYHVIVPSLPGYAYSANIPTDADYGIDTAAVALNNLMVGLGFGDGYLVQGGDLGSFISRFLAMGFDACKGMHVNMMGIPAEALEGPTSEQEKIALARGAEFVDTSMAFVLEQGSRPATVGFVLSSSPLALLSWIGEKYLEWTDEDPPLEKILEVVTLYWMTDTMSRCFYHNRAVSQYPIPICSASLTKQLMSNANDDPKIARISVVRLICPHPSCQATTDTATGHRHGRAEEDALR
jgi:microsomal epoxide hydrolase